MLRVLGEESWEAYAGLGSHVFSERKVRRQASILSCGCAGTCSVGTCWDRTALNLLEGVEGIVVCDVISEPQC